MHRLLQWILLLPYCFGAIILMASASLMAAPIIFRNTPGIEQDDQNYSFVILKAALEHTREEYGDYVLQYAKKPMSRNRTYEQMQSGAVTIADTTVTEISQEHLRVPIPTQRGILSFRLFLVRAQDKDLLQNVKTLDELRRYTTGAASQWMSTGLLKDSQFKVVEGPDKDALVKMLIAGRFDTYARGVNEIYGELERYVNLKDKITVDPHLALYFYLPTYFHVTRLRPDLAERIHKGLIEINKNGEHERIFLEYHREMIEKAHLEKRRIILLKKNHEQLMKDYQYLFLPKGVHIVNG